MEAAKRSIRKSISILASSAQVWNVFTEPSITRKLGGEYVCDWKPGSSLSWKSLKGQMLTQGKLIEIVPKKLIKHSLQDESNNIISVISYAFKETGANSEYTILEAREDPTHEMTDEEFKDVERGWDQALKLVKETAERLN